MFLSKNTRHDLAHAAQLLPNISTACCKINQNPAGTYLLIMSHACLLLIISTRYKSKLVTIERLFHKKLTTIKYLDIHSESTPCNTSDVETPHARPPCRGRCHGCPSATPLKQRAISVVLGILGILPVHTLHLGNAPALFAKENRQLARKTTQGRERLEQNGGKEKGGRESSWSRYRGDNVADSENSEETADPTHVEIRSGLCCGLAGRNWEFGLKKGFELVWFVLD